MSELQIEAPANQSHNDSLPFSSFLHEKKNPVEVDEDGLIENYLVDKDMRYLVTKVTYILDDIAGDPLI